MRRTEITQPKSFSPPALTFGRAIMVIAAALVTVALLMASYRVGSLYSPTTILWGPAPYPSVLHSIPEAVFYAMGGHHVVPQG